MEKILIVVDMQKDFVDGSLGTEEAQAIVPDYEYFLIKFIIIGMALLSLLSFKV